MIETKYGITLDTTTFPRELDRTTDGITTCLWHRQWVWSMMNYVPKMPRCALCGGICDPRQTAHELCKALARRGRPTPQLDGAPKCGCAKCVAGVNRF